MIGGPRERTEMHRQLWGGWHDDWNRANAARDVWEAWSDTIPGRFESKDGGYMYAYVKCNPAQKASALFSPPF